METDTQNTGEQKGREHQDIPALLKWQMREEKGEHSRDKELIIILIGLTATVLAVMAETYIFGALLAIATGVFVHNGRQEPKEMLFKITAVGVFLENDFLSREEIEGFNIIDDPGSRARLLLKIQKIIPMNEIIPIHDVDIQKVEEAMQKLRIKKDTALEPNMLDNITTLI